MELAQRRIGEMVSEDYRYAEVFKRYGLDFCCGGGLTVADACTRKGVIYDTLAQELVAVVQGDRADLQPASWEPNVLVDHIIAVHHAYVRTTMPLILEFIRKVARVHGHASPEVVEIAGLFEAIASELSNHMLKEEQILFPYVRRLVDAAATDAVLAAPFGTVRNPIIMMEHEHEHALALMDEIRRLSDDFMPPDYACNTYRVVYHKLEEFEADLHRHIHLENDILFPRALALEKAHENVLP